jgi:hypothetical protein
VCNDNESALLQRPSCQRSIVPAAHLMYSSTLCYRPSRAATVAVKYTPDKGSEDESCSEKRHGSSDEESATSSDESSSDEESDDDGSSESESELEEPGAGSEDDWEERDAEQQDAEDGEDVFSLYKSSRDRFRAQSTLQNAVESASAAEIPVWSGLTEASLSCCYS